MNNDKFISLAHGNGGRLMNELINNIIAPAFNMKKDQISLDAVPLNTDYPVMITTDGFTVDPLFFPGGDIGKLAVCGTLNDLLVSGAIPEYLTVNFFIEEGFPVSDLNRIVTSMGETAKHNDVSIIAGDTKVLPKDSVSGIQIATTGIGKTLNTQLSLSQIKPNDLIFCTGPLGDHGVSVMLAREAYGLHGEVKSDCQSVKAIAESLMALDGLKFMRDPTRGGLTSVCHEIAQACSLGINLIEKDIPIRDSVKSFCELLGFNPLQMACEGRIIFIAHPSINKNLLSHISKDIVQIGSMTQQHSQVIIETPLGGFNIVPELENETLPRIC